MGIRTPDLLHAMGNADVHCRYLTARDSLCHSMNCPGDARSDVRSIAEFDDRTPGHVGTRRDEHGKGCGMTPAGSSAPFGGVQYIAELVYPTENLGTSLAGRSRTGSATPHRGDCRRERAGYRSDSALTRT